MKRIISLLILFSVLFSLTLPYASAFSESEVIIESLDTIEEITEKDGYRFDSRGFLTGDGNPSEENEMQI